MKPLVEKYTTLTEDLTDLVLNWKDNPNRTIGQLKYWSSDKIMEFLGKDPKNCIRLLKEDGYDNLPVFENHLSENILESIANHEIISLSDNEICRMSIFFHLNVHQAFIMIIKSKWEKLVSEKIKSKQIEKFNFFDDTANQIQAFIGSISKDENLSVILKLLDSAFGSDMEKSSEKELFKSVTGLFLISRTFFFPIRSKEIETYIENQNELMGVVKAENQEFNEIFHARHQQWVNLILGAELTHLKLEEQRIQNAEIEKEWLNEFGVLYFDLIKDDFECNSLKRQIAIKKEYPTFTKEELILADSEAIEAEQLKINQLENDLRISEIASMVSGKKSKEFQGNVDEEIFGKYKKALRTIWLKTHPDRLIDKLFSPQQIEKLHNYYLRATELSTGERIVNPRNLERLQEIIAEIDQIYENMGINLPLNFTVQGITMKEKVHWLENQISLLENEIAMLKNEYFTLASDSSVKQKQESMLSPEVIDLVKIQLASKRDNLKVELEQLNNELNGMF